MSEEKISLRKFLIWFFSGQTKAWLVSEMVNDTMLQADSKRDEWKKLAEKCGFILENN